MDRAELPLTRRVNPSDGCRANTPVLTPTPNPPKGPHPSGACPRSELNIGGALSNEGNRQSNPVAEGPDHVGGAFRLV